MKMAMIAVLDDGADGGGGGRGRGTGGGEGDGGGGVIKAKNVVFLSLCYSIHGAV